MEMEILGQLSNRRLGVRQCQVSHFGQMDLVRRSSFFMNSIWLTIVQALVDQVTATPLDL